jgi:hypothetical protein
MILGQSISDAATLTASSEIGTLPGAAVQRVQPRDIWRSTSNADQNLVLDLGAVSNFNFVAVLYHNADASALWRIRTADTEAGLTSAPDYDSSTMSMRSSGDEDRYGRFHSIKSTSAQSNRWVRLDFTTLSGMSTLDVGRVIVANGLDKAPAYGWNYNVTEETEPIATAGGLWARAGRKYRSISWSYPALTDAQAFETAGEIDNNLRAPVVVSIIETDASRQTDWTFYGYLQNITSQYVLAGFNLRTYNLIEMERP